MLRRIFLGRDGLRAGWSIALFILLAVAIAAGGQVLLIHFHLLPLPPATGSRQPLQSGTVALSEGEILAGFAFAAWVMSWVERRPFGRYGLSTRRMIPDLFAGLLWGFVALSLLVGALRLSHGIVFDGAALHGAAATLYGFKWAAAFLCVGMFEEFFFRGYLQYTLTRGVAGALEALAPGTRHKQAVGFWVAAFLLSVLLFAGSHTGNGGETLLGIFQVGLAGTVFAFSLYRTGTLWWAIGMHTAWDWAQSYFYGTPDSGAVAAGHLLATHPLGSTLLSGGPAGPEGSVLCIPTLLLVLLVIHLTLPKRDPSRAFTPLHSD